MEWFMPVIKHHLWETKNVDPPVDRCGSLASVINLWKNEKLFCSSTASNHRAVNSQKQGCFYMWSINACLTKALPLLCFCKKVVVGGTKDEKGEWQRQAQKLFACNFGFACHCLVDGIFGSFFLLNQDVFYIRTQIIAFSVTPFRVENQQRKRKAIWNMPCWFASKWHGRCSRQGDDVCAQRCNGWPLLSRQAWIVKRHQAHENHCNFSELLHFTPAGCCMNFPSNFMFLLVDGVAHWHCLKHELLVGCEVTNNPSNTSDTKKVMQCVEMSLLKLWSASKKVSPHAENHAEFLCQVLSMLSKNDLHQKNIQHGIKFSAEKSDLIHWIWHHCSSSIVFCNYLVKYEG